MRSTGLCSLFMQQKARVPLSYRIPIVSGNNEIYDIVSERERELAMIMK